MMLRCFFSMPTQVGFLTAAKPDSEMCQACKALLRPMAGTNCAAKKPTILFRIPIHCRTGVIPRVIGWQVVALADIFLAH